MSCVSAPYLTPHTRTTTSNADALLGVDRDLLDELLTTGMLPERLRVVFMADRPHTAFPLRDCALLHVPHLPQPDFVETLCREYCSRQQQQQQHPPPLAEHFRFYVTQLCVVLQSRRALRDTAEVRYLLLTAWPRYEVVARSLSLEDFKTFLRVAMQQRRPVAPSSHGSAE